MRKLRAGIIGGGFIGAQHAEAIRRLGYTEQGARGVFTVSQASAGHKNKLSFEVSGSRASARWDADAPHDLWLGFRDKANELLSKDPSLVAPEVKAYTHLPGGHHEAWRMR